ncbi:RnfABCDGE type electron transport complex subunit D [Desulforhopalus sp. IMCC35007]|uniref:RnfABCDGE type electron transport complex subunit D n=1 Tax=Desulforhopalus sp. IMCC35007 TaxID=2569543 RepID=UPI0010AE31EB|nr:RnfABCDGE type electron transport complex subunit D [Desulforhopalus sp. IMCC35007]TKB08215.1 electron transporter RnfD [Desulforhopalus sp. IMCC35007]
MKELKMYEQSAGAEPRMLNVAVGPHYRVGSGLAEIYQRWVIALIPAIAASLYYFGSDALRVFGLSVSFAVAIDFMAEKLAPSRDLTSNWSSVSLALLLAFMLPVNAPWWLILIGCFFMVVVGKKFFGGVGSYPAQPAVLTVAMLQLSWPHRMDYTAALSSMDWTTSMVEPLRLLKSIGASAESQYHIWDLLIGQQVSGTACGMVIFILIGGIFLLAMREIQWQLPAGFIISLLATAYLLRTLNPEAIASPLFYLLSGGTLFMGFFLVSDHTTSPVNKVPMFLYGMIAGILLMLIRGYSKHVDGIVFAVLLANLCSPLLDMIKPKVKGANNE